jgi:hypothetical protein
MAQSLAASLTPGQALQLQGTLPGSVAYDAILSQASNQAWLTAYSTGNQGGMPRSKGDSKGDGTAKGTGVVKSRFLSEQRGRGGAKGTAGRSKGDGVRWPGFFGHVN